MALTPISQATIQNGYTGVFNVEKGDMLFSDRNRAEAFRKLTIGNPTDILGIRNGLPAWISASSMVLNTLTGVAVPFALTTNHILVGNAGGLATDVAMSGDATIVASGALTIANDAVTFAKMQNVSTAILLGRNTVGSGNIEELSTIPTAVQDNITRLGTIVSGVWNGSVIGTTYTTAQVISVSGVLNRTTISGTGTDPIVDISATYAGQASIITLGTISTGVWQGTSISTSYTDAKIISVTGTANRLTIGGTATDPTFDISASYVGQASITTLGTIGTGVWQGTAIADAYIASAATWHAKLSSVLTDGYIFVGNALNVATGVLPSGDVTLTNAGVTAIGANKVVTSMILNSNVTLAKLANIADQTILGNNTGGAAAPLALSAAQTKTILSLNNVENTALSTWAGTTNITTLGTISTGVWNGSTLSEVYGGTNQTTYATGDILYASAANTLSKLAAGTNGHVLTLAAGVPTWAAGGGGGAVGANPTASVGLVAVNGVALTFMRSDAAPPLDVGISPTWSGTHTFSNTIVGSINGNAATATILQTARNINGVAFDGSANITVTAAAGTLTGITLNATVVTSSLTSVGTIGTGVWQGTAIADAYIASAATWNAKLTSALTDGYIFVGNALNVATGVLPSGDVTFDNAGVTAIGANKVITSMILNSNVTLAKLANIADQTFLGNNSGLAAAPLALTIAQAKTMLDLTGTNSGDQTITLTGDVTGSGTGSFAATIANDAVTTAKILNSNVTLAKLANIADQTILGNNTGGAAAPLALNASQTKTILSLNNVENTALSTWAGTTNITTLGTIATGVWSGTAVGPTKGGTGFTTYTTGDIIYASAANTLSKLGVGANGDVLTLAAGVPTWAVPTGGGGGGLTHPQVMARVSLRI